MNNKFTTSLIRYYNFISNKKVIILSLVTTALLTFVLNRIYHSVSKNSDAGAIFFQLAFFRKNLEIIIASWGLEGIKIFLDMLWINFLYPISYSLLLSSSIAFITLRKRGNEPNQIAVKDIMFFCAPYIAAFMDIVAYTFFAIILKMRIYSESLIVTASIASLLKWIILISVVILILRTFLSFKKKTAHINTERY